MLSYDVLDSMADAVNPVLGVLSLIVPWCRKRRWRAALLINVLTLLAVGLAYAFQGIDRSLGLWSAAGLDFSTHTAVFCGIASSLCHLGKSARVGVVALGVAYGVLMLVQRYHSLLDITTTAAAMIGPLWLMWWWALRAFSKALT